MADFSMKRSLSSRSSEEEEDQQAEEQELEVESKPSSPAILPNSPARRSRGTVALLSPSQATSTARKPRGRPPGSKNKPKPPVYITKETEGGMKTQQLEIPAGCDVVEMIQKFTRKHRVGAHVVNGSGSVSNFTLRHPAITLSGVFNILSLSGTFMGSSVCNSSSKERTAHSPPWLAIFVGGSAGEVFGGTVVGKVIAASNVLLNVSTFSNYEFHRVEPGEFGDGEEENNRGRLTVEDCSASGASMASVGFAVPADHLSWAPPPNAAAAIRPSPNHHY